LKRFQAEVKTMNKRYEVVLPPKAFGDALWHAGIFREGNCLGWNSFSSKSDAEQWARSAQPAARETRNAFSRN
jgi:hypothetical protein